MFYPIMGGSGTGKTHYILQKAGELALRGEKVIIIVPEQFSFETERSVYRSFGAQAALNIEVLSFTRLCSKVFYTYGGVAGEYISDIAKQTVISLAVGELADKLEIYSSAVKNPTFAATILTAIEEFKNAGILPEQVAQTALEVESQSLSGKLTELSEIYAVYKAIIDAGYLDGKDDLARCVKTLESHSFFSEYTVLIDSFMTYMAGEYVLINRIIGEAKDTYITFICNSLADKNGGMGVFSVAVKTAERIIKMAKASAVEVHTPIKLTECYRFKNAELVFLQQAYPQQLPDRYDKKATEIKIVEAKDPYDEITYVAATICKLVREDGMRYKDIAVIARNIDRFATAVEDIFERYNIPVFADKRDDLLTVPLIRGVLAALDAVDKGFDTSALIAFAKSTLMGLSALEVASLENYCYIWNIKGTAWKNEFTANPNGLTDKFSDKDKKQLDDINITRGKLIKPLITLRETIKGCTGKEFSIAIYSFLTEIHATENMKAYLERNDDISGRYIHLNNSAWEIIMEILNIFARIIGDKTLPTGQYIQLFKNAVTASDLGSIPHTLDQTIVGIADRIRPNAPKVTFVIGANEGLFPPIMSENGLFTDIQREQLISLGLEISPPAIEKNLYEAYYAYFALTTPSQKLVVSYHTSLLSGEQPKPSIIVQKLKTIFNIEPILTSSLSSEYFVATAKTAFDTACRNIRQNDTLAASIMEAVRKTEYNTNFDKVLSTLNKTPFYIQDRAVSSELFGKEMKLSPSRIEEYYKCPFSLFCNLGLKLKPIRRVEFSPLESGNTIHYVLEKLIAANTGKGLLELTEDEIRIQVAQLLEEYLRTQTSGQEEFSSRLSYLFTRLVNSLTKLVMHLQAEFAQSRFEPIAFELDMADSEKVTPIKLDCIDGSHVEIVGKIDRVDIMDNGEEKYIRVVDYKSGIKTFKLSDIYYGLNLQMLVYLFTLWQNGEGELENCLPAGILYMPSGDKIITISRKAEQSEVEKSRMAKYKMNGLVLQDIQVITGMEQQGAGVLIPARITSKGEIDGRSSVANLAQMGMLKRYIQKLISEMAENLHDGKIAAQPVDGGGYAPCDYCPYHAVCGHEKEDKKRDVTAIDNGELFEMLKAEEGEKE